MRRRGAFERFGAAAAWLVLTACGRSGDERAVLSVFAASSLTDAFEDLERGFERSHPAVDVALTFAGSQVLRLQIEHGATADVFASADERHMDALADAGLVTAAQRFAGNELVVIVPRANPAGIDAFADLPRASRVVLGTPSVPVGAYTEHLLERASARLGPAFATTVRAHVVSQESNVRLVRAKVELGEADAAIVYRSDAGGSDRVGVVPIPASLNVAATYPIAATKASSHPAEAAAFIAYVRSDDGQQVLTRHGFATGTP